MLRLCMCLYYLTKIRLSKYPTILQLRRELTFGYTRTHGSRRRDPSSDSLNKIICIVSTTPLQSRVSMPVYQIAGIQSTDLLMSENVASQFTLFALDKLYICLHACLGVIFGE